MGAEEVPQSEEKQFKQEDGANYAAIAPVLNNLDKVFIKQPFRASEFIKQFCLGCEANNLYTVQSMNGTQTLTPFWTLKEESSWCGKQCFRANRGLELHATSYQNEDFEQPTFTITKELRFGCCCISPQSLCGRSLMKISIGNVLIGSVEEECLCALCRVRFSVYDQNESLQYIVERNMCQCQCKKIPFLILLPDGTDTNCAISKVWSGFKKELFTSNDY